MPDGIFPIDLLVFQFQVAASRDINGSTLCNLDGLLVWATFFGGHHFLVGVDQVIVLQSEDSFIGWLDLEVAVPRGSFSSFDIKGSKTGLSEVCFQDLPTLAVVYSAQLETLAELGGSQHLVFLFWLRAGRGITT